MPKNKAKIIYFGTNRSSGHTAIGIDADLSHEEYNRFCECDNDYWIDKLYREPDKHTRYVRHYSLIYTVYSIPMSVDDHRLNSHTDLFWEGRHTEEEMESFIKGNDFLKRQFGFTE